MYDNNGMMMGQQPTMGGYAYQGMGQPVQKINNVLTPDQIKRLQQKSQNFSLAISEEEMLRGICTHRNAEGTADALVFDPMTGIARCTICGYEFKPIDPDIKPENLKADVDNIVDILQTIKLMYVDLPAEAAKEYFPIIPLIEKIPQLFEFAAKNMAKHEIFNWQYNNRNMGAVSMFNNLQNMFANGVAYNPAYNNMNGYMPQQPMMGQPQQFAPQQPVAGYPGMSNGFGYPGASQPTPNPAFAMGGYAPQTAGYQFVPGQQPVAPQATTPVAPEAPQASDNGTVTKNVTV